MGEIALITPAGEVSAELIRLGFAAEAPVRVTVALVEAEMSGAAIAQTGGAFEWLNDEPDLYSDADLRLLDT